MHARLISGLFTLLALAVLATVVSLATKAPSDVAGLGRAPGANDERLEQRLTTDMRLDALEDARADGSFGRRQTVVTAAAPGWTGEQLMNVGTDDWEPAVAADPNSSFVYLLTTRYGQPKPCPGNCPVPHIAIEISDDNGQTWSEGAPLCACKGSGQFDPIIEVVADTGHVYALWMNGFNVVFQRSTNHGADVVGARSYVGQRLLERQAGARVERRRAGRLRVVERPHGRRPVDRPVARLRRHVVPEEGRRQPPVLLRLRCRGHVRRDRPVLGEQLRLLGAGGERDRTGPAPRVHLPGRGCDLGATSPRRRRPR